MESGMRNKWVHAIWCCSWKFVSIIGSPQWYHPLASFVLLGWAEARLLNFNFPYGVVSFYRESKNKNTLFKKVNAQQKHYVYKYIKMKFSVVSYIQTSTVSTKETPWGKPPSLAKRVEKMGGHFHEASMVQIRTK